MSLENILLLSCRSPFLDDSKIYCPMANLYLKAFLNKFNPKCNVTLGDDNYDIDFSQFDAVGISVMTPQREEASKLAREIKSKHPEKTIIVGGPHIKHYKNEAEKNPNFDYLVPLDGERPLLDLSLGKQKSRVLVDVMSKEDIAKSPRPDRTSDNAIEVIGHYNYRLGGRRATTMMTSRGCPMACAFCEDARTIAKWSSLENLREEMDDIKRLNFGAVYLFDDLFAIAMDKVRPIAEELKKRDLIYRCNGQANFFTKWGEEFAKLLSDTGCYEIAFGHESGNQTILDNVDKKTKVWQNYKSVEYARKYGIKVKSFLMIGLPGETYETIQDTIRFINEAKPDDFQLSIYYPFRGTQIRDRIDRGETFDLYFEGEGLGAYGQKGGNTESVVRTRELSSQELLQIRDEIVKAYKPVSHGEMWKDKFFETPKIYKQ